MATMVGRGTLTLHHHQLGEDLGSPTPHGRGHAHGCGVFSEPEPRLANQSEPTSDPGLISTLRAELGLSSSDLFSMTVTDYDMKPGVRPPTPTPSDAPTPPLKPRLSPPEGLRGSSVGSHPLRVHRQLSLQAPGERGGREESPRLLQTRPPTPPGGEPPAQVKPTDPSRGLQAGDVDPGSVFVDSSPRGGSCSSPPPPRRTSPSSGSSPPWRGRSAPWVGPRPCRHAREGHGGRRGADLCLSPPGVRHFAALQLIGVGDRATGSLQLFPLNGEPVGGGGGGGVESALMKRGTSPSRRRSDRDGAAVSPGRGPGEAGAAGEQGLLQPAVRGEGRRGQGLVPLPPVDPGQHLRPGGLHRGPPPRGEAAGPSGRTLPRRQRVQDRLQTQVNGTLGKLE